MKGVYRLIIGTTIVALAGACAAPTRTGGSAGAGPAPQSGPIVIGAILSLSGPYASLGVAEQHALQALEVDLAPINGRKVVIRVVNDGSDPTQAAAHARALAGDPRVLGIVGPSVTATMYGAFPVLEAAKVPWIVLTPNPYPNFNREPYVFGPNIGSLGSEVTKFKEFFATRGIDPASVAAIANDDASGQAIAKAFKASGMPRVVLAPTSLTDYTALLRGLQSSHVKGLVNIQSGSNAGYVCRAQKAIGYDVPLVLAPNALNASFLRVAGDKADGAYALTVGALADPSTLEDREQARQASRLQRAFQAVARQPLTDAGTVAAMAYDAGLSFYTAARHAGTTIDRVSLQRQMIGQTYVGAGGFVRRSDGDHAGFSDASWLFVVIKDGALRPATA